MFKITVVSRLTNWKFLQVVGALNVAELNNVNIKKFLDDVVLLDVEANITAKKNFIDLKTARLSTRDLSSNSVYPDVMGTARQAIRLDVNDTVNGTIVFATVTVSKNVQTSRLNNQHFPSGFVSLDGDQELSETLEVDKITMLGDILLEDGARVNGLDLKVECTNTWMVDDFFQEFSWNLALQGVFIFRLMVTK